MIRDSKGHTAMVYAIAGFDLEAVKLLLQAGVDVNSRQGVSAGTPLLLTSFYGSLEIFEFLLSRGADLGLLTPNQSSCLGIATLYSM